MKTVSVRDLRTRFPRIKAMIEQEGEIIVTDHGRPRYVLKTYGPPARSRPQPVNYWARLRQRQPRPLSAAARRALGEADPW